MYEEKLISGKEIASAVKARVKEQAWRLAGKGIVPKLSVIIVGDDPASRAYVRGKHRDCAECGIISENIRLPEDVETAELLSRIDALNRDDSVHGILVQLPLPPHIDEYRVINAIDPEKDVDGFTAENVGKMHIGRECFLPCTPSGCIDMLKYAGVEIAGKDAVVIGRSNIVGKPAAALLLAENATVTVCHSRTRDIARKTKNADIVIVAVGKAGFLTGDMLKTGAVVVDVGINRDENGKLRGDADFDSCVRVASKITPVPGGVGLMTRANLLKNTVRSARRRLERAEKKNIDF